MMHVQMMMDNLPKPDKPPGHSTFAQVFEDKEVPIENKLRIAGWIYKFETHNGFTKNDLVAVIRWLIDQNYDWVPDKAHLKVVPPEEKL